MADITDKEWYRQFVKQHELAYGCVPPPWEAIPNSHPFSMRWRMGYGSSLQDVFPVWLRQYFPSEESRVAFFWKHPPPPRWQPYLIEAIFDAPPPEPEISVYDPDWYENSGFPAKLKVLGFRGTDRFREDLDDPQWIAEN